MKVLIVEDDLEFYEDILLPTLQSLAPNAEFSHAKSKNSAVAFIEALQFDFVTLDLKLPVDDGGIDIDSNHGLVVFRELRRLTPGTPILVLTGSRSDGHVDEVIGAAHREDIFGLGEETCAVDWLPKGKLDQLPNRLRPSFAAINALRDVEVGKIPADLVLPPNNERLIRIFTKRNGGARCNVRKLTGGLSDTHVYSINVLGGMGELRLKSVGKMGPHEKIRNEVRKQAEVRRLSREATPRFHTECKYGGGDRSGVFYELAEDTDRNLFGLAIEDDAAAAAAVIDIKEKTRPWRLENEERRTVREVRQVLLSDADAAAIVRANHLQGIDDFESRPFQGRWGTIHGDLHGANILATAAGRAVMIDYNDIGGGPRLLDPLTIELSFHFHPDGPARQNEWANRRVGLWHSPSEYLETCPYPQLVQSVRAWIAEDRVRNRDVAACGYAYCLRQLKYDTTDAALALQFIAMFRELFDT